jgi:hypothetical protein
MTMLENIARAIQQSAIYAGRPKPWESLDDLSRKSYLGQARAALNALMEPTQEMRDAAYEAGDDGAGVGWQAMIRAALSERP